MTGLPSDSPQDRPERSEATPVAPASSQGRTAPGVVSDEQTVGEPTIAEIVGYEFVPDTGASFWLYPVCHPAASDGRYAGIATPVPSVDEMAVWLKANIVDPPWNSSGEFTIMPDDGGWCVGWHCAAGTDMTPTSPTIHGALELAVRAVYNTKETAR